MMNEEAILAWIEENLNANLDVIEDLSHVQIKQMVQDREYVLIYTCKFWLPYTGPPRQARQARFGPCLDFGFQYAFLTNNRSNKFVVENWTLPDSNSPWWPC